MLTFNPEKLLDIGRWFDTQPGPGSLWHPLLGTLLLLMAFVGIYLYNFTARSLREKRYQRMIIVNTATGMMYIGFIGAFLCAFRVLDLPFFGMRLWLYTDLLIGLGLLVYLIYYMVRVYPTRMRFIRRQQEMREYRPRVAVRRT